MLSKMMLEQGNVLLFNEPTNHLDIESITALNEGLKKFNGVIIMCSHDLELIDTIATRIIEIKEDGTIKDYELTYQEYIKKLNL